MPSSLVCSTLVLLLFRSLVADAASRTRTEKDLEERSSIVLSGLWRLKWLCVLILLPPLFLVTLAILRDPQTPIVVRLLLLRAREVLGTPLGEGAALRRELLRDAALAQSQIAGRADIAAAAAASAAAAAEDALRAARARNTTSAAKGNLLALRRHISHAVT